MEKHELESPITDWMIENVSKEDYITKNFKSGQYIYIGEVVRLIRLRERLIKADTRAQVNYDAVLGIALLDWFENNYNETRYECARLIIKSQIDYPFTAEQLKEGCVELRKTLIENESLFTHIKLIGDLCNIGVSARIAGEQIRDALLKMQK